MQSRSSWIILEKEVAFSPPWIKLGSFQSVVAILILWMSFRPSPLPLENTWGLPITSTALIQKVGLEPLIDKIAKEAGGVDLEERCAFLNDHPGKKGSHGHCDKINNIARNFV
jgi:hypothetical protein